MKKIISILILSFLIFSNSNAYNLTNSEEKLMDNFAQKLQDVDKYKLEKVNERLDSLLINYNSWGKVKFLLTQIQDTIDAEIQEKWQVSYVSHDFILDFSDLKNVLWFSHNFFVAKVLKNNWTNSDLNTDFEVEVLYNIKWNLKWKIDTVFQGWYDENNVLYVWNDTRFLEVWSVYLLVTMGDSNKISAHQNWVTLLSKNDKNINEVIKNSNEIEKFRQAYFNESDFDTPNSFESLSESNKQNLQNFDSWFVSK